MAKTKLYIARHGKTMFNTIGRAQGWSDSPLTEAGERGIHELGIGLREAGIQFQLPYRYDKRIREWCFGSFDGAYDGELFLGVLPRVFRVDDFHHLSLMELAEGIVEVDTAGWAESWETLRDRILDGFTTIAKDVESQGGGNAIVVSHGMTISTLIYLIDPKAFKELVLDNGSVTIIEYEDGQFKLEAVGDLSYRQVGAKWLEGDHD